MSTIRYYVSFLLMLLAPVLLPDSARAQNDERIDIPGTRASIIPPQGYHLFNTGALIYNQQLGASILAEESYLPFDGNVRYFSDWKEQQERGLMSIGTPEDFRVNDMEVWRTTFTRMYGLIHPRTAFYQVHVIGDASESLLLIETYPDTMSRNDVADLLSCISTLRWDRTKPVNPMKMLHFSIQPAGGFQLQSDKAHFLVYEPPEAASDTAEVIPRFTVGLFNLPGGTLTEQEDELMIERLLKSFHPSIAVNQVLEFKNITLDGILGYETVSYAKDIATDSTVIVYFAVLKHPVSYITMAGLTYAADQDTNISLFKTMAHSFRRTGPDAGVNGGCAELLRGLRYAEALDCFESALKNDPKSLSDLLGKADALRLLNRHKEAINCYSDIIAQDATAEQAFLGRGKSYAETERYRFAIADFDKVIGLNANSLGAYMERARAKYDDGNIDGAARDYDRAIALAPDSVPLYLRGAEAALNSSRVDKAIEWYTTAITLDRKCYPAYYGRGGAYWKQDKYEEALKDYTRAIEISPKHKEAFFARGSIYNFLGDNEKTVSDLDKAIQLGTRTAEVYLLRGSAHTSLAHTQPALSDFAKASSYDTTNYGPYLLRGILYFLARDYRKSDAEIRHAARYSASPQVWCWLYFIERKVYGQEVALNSLHNYSNSQIIYREDNEVRYILGYLDDDELIGHAKEDKGKYSPWYAKNFPLCEAYFAIGMRSYLQGMRLKAKKYWQMCLETKAYDNTDFRFVRTILSGKWQW